MKNEDDKKIKQQIKKKKKKEAMKSKKQQIPTKDVENVNYFFTIILYFDSYFDLFFITMVTD